MAITRQVTIPTTPDQYTADWLGVLHTYYLSSLWLSHDLAHNDKCEFMISEHTEHDNAKSVEEENVSELVMFEVSTVGEGAIWSSTGISETLEKVSVSTTLDQSCLVSVSTTTNFFYLESFSLDNFEN